MTPRRLISGLGIVALVFPATSLTAQSSDCPDWVARTVSAQGRVEARRAGQPQWLPVKLEATHCPGDAVRLGPLSRAALVLRDGAVLRLDQNTTITFTPPAERAATWIELLTGAVHFWSRTPRTLRITTPFVNGSVEGTEFLIEVDAIEARLSVWEGQILAENAQGTLVLTAGQSAAARAGQPPTLRPIIVRPTDAVAWTLYYPPVLDLRPEDVPDRPGETWPAELRRSIAAARAGDLEAAFASLARVPDTVSDPRVSVYRASLLLAVGRVDEARPAIERALALDPGHAPALALQSVVALAQNARADAVRLANDAVARDPASATALVAQSYARQAAFDLAGARESLEAAARLEPGSALVRARLAELWLAEGRLDRALREAEEAVRLEPGLGRTHTVLGFVRLARLEVGRAAEAFERAIALDSAAPLSRLGRGLARIRRGDLSGGRQELEIAVSLDPGDSLLRSYLGKAYYEERRPEPAASQLERAQALDPADPTPWFYQAILQQSVNRPVEGLGSLQRSIALNDNRAVYRSSLLLDEDLAARTASLGRIYGDLGFQQRALVEGWRSLDVDPANFSAHRFLADSYSALPRHETARVSELLQSQLLQPLNIQPVQPQLALSNSFILSGAGPATPSFNEFNALFERNRLSLLATGVVGGNETYGDQVALSGVWNRFSLSVGQFHYETDGFRPNNDLTQNLYNVFAQVRLAPRTSVLAEFRTSDVEKGDLPLRFDPANFNPNQRQEDRETSIRAGLRHGFTPNSDLLATFVYQDADFETRNAAARFRADLDVHAYTGEIQHILRLRRFSLVGGGGYFSGTSRTTTTINPPSGPLSSATEDESTHGNLYLYAYVHYPESVTWTLGASGDLFDDEIFGLSVSRDQANPKLGVAWNPFRWTTLRAAAFRTLKRPFVTNQTIEPTQVAGFNQFFDDVNGTDAWRYGGAIDQRLSETLYAGAEYSQRDLDRIPFRALGAPPTLGEVDRHEELVRAYLYWAPHPWLALSAEYQYERFERDPAHVGVEQFTEVSTHRVPLGVNFFHPTGFIARLWATFVDQDGKFGDPRNAPVVGGSDRFWVADALIGYRLPKRLGLVTLQVRNLFDERFRFQDTDPANPTIYPERLVVLKLTLAY